MNGSSRVSEGQGIEQHFFIFFVLEFINKFFCYEIEKINLTLEVG